MKLMILDGNSIINRAYFGVRPLTTRDGLHTNAIFGFLNILQKLMNEETPDAVCVAFDLKGPTFRHLQYEAYKGTRKGMPDELAMQMPVMKDVLRAMSIPIYEVQGYEADDVIGTVGRKCGEAGWDCVIVTGDRDSLQLVDDHVTVKLVVTKSGQTSATRYDRDTFFDEYGLEPKGIIDLKSLMGDTSDNIPGVAGVGQKTASALLQQFGSTENLYANLDSPDIKESVRKKLAAGREMAFLSYDLATIRCDAPLDFTPEANLVRPWDKKALYDLFLRLEFVKLIDKYGLRSAESAPEVTEVTQTVVPVVLAEDAATLPELWKQADHVCVLPLANLEGVAVLCGDRADLVLRDRPGGDEALAVLFSGAVRKVAHPVKELQRALLEQGLATDGFVFDTALAAYFLDPSAGSYDVEKLSVSYLGREIPKATIFDDPAVFSGFDADQIAQALDGLGQHLAVLEALYGVLPPQLEEKGMDKLYYEVDLPLCAVLAEMEHTGVLVDRQALAAFGQMLSERIDDCQALVYDLAGEKFNINSPKKLGEILFEKLGLPPAKKTKTGYSTNIDVLNKLRDQNPIVQAVIDYRALTKLKSTYADGLLKFIADDGRIHTTFQNTVTATGRLSSTDPNLQNIPVRTELGGEIRRMFVPKPGCVLVDADYSQIELRVLAHIADDAIMQEAFRSGEDVHRVTASQVFGVPPEQVTPEMRRSAKAVNFGIVYGISEFSLSEDIGVSFGEAKAYIQSYLDHYAGVKAYMSSVVENARESGYVTTLMGRRRNLPELHSSNFNVRSGAERMALNTPIQGTAADIIKLAMLRVRDALRDAGLDARLILQVHDELIVETPEAEAEQVCRLVEAEMEQVCDLSVPLIAEAKTGKSWYDAK
jgi:DNA polymerase-1